MGPVLVVCTGNICRSPLGEGFLDRALRARLGDDSPPVRSAGTAGWEGSSATPESVEAGAEHGLDIAGHVARRLRPPLVEGSALVLTMTTAHRDEILAMVPAAARRTFTLKELTRLAEALPAPASEDRLEDRLAMAADLRATGFDGNPHDDDVTDPLGMPLDTYRAIAWEIETYTDRLVRALLGPAHAVAREAG